MHIEDLVLNANLKLKFVRSDSTKTNSESHS